MFVGSNFFVDELPKAPKSSAWLQHLLTASTAVLDGHCAFNDLGVNSSPSGLLIHIYIYTYILYYI